MLPQKTGGGHLGADLHWFELSLWGRGANEAAKILGDLSLRESIPFVLRPREIRDRCFLRDRVLKAPPLKLTPTCLMSWVVFADGACEGPDGAKNWQYRRSSGMSSR